jgi:1-phosphofructokinase family hexose kinase
MNIITITLNPAFDVHCSAPKLTLYRENLAEITSTDAGGKGINISRALTLNGTDNLAFTILGDENGESFERALSAEGINYRALRVKGRIRENITCHTEGASETRISFKGFSIDKEVLQRTIDSLLPEICGDTVMTFTGRVPLGIGMGAIKEFLRVFSEKGARIVIDSRSFSLDDLRELHPWLIKPNQEEISEYLGREINSFDEITAAATALHRDGIENVMISLGGDGAMLVCDDGNFVATPPKIDALSTIGAGDSSIAGFLAAVKRKKKPIECLCTAVAYGSAACLTEGTKPPRKEDIERLLPLINTKSL